MAFTENLRHTTDDIRLIIDKIKRDKGFDLSGYRESTLSRRIERRMQFDGAKSLEEYMRMIDRDYHLYWRLVSDFFIGVTDFFRDKEIWDIMREQVLPQVISSKLSVISKKEKKLKTYDLKLKTAFKPILRIWSAGCSTGEETHSFAILLIDVLGNSISNFLIYIYGTDIMEDKLEVARKSEYEADKVEKVEERLREKYFESSAISFQPSAKDYKLKAYVRRLTRFRKYDLVQGEELRGFDVIICRNVLIYFQKHLQEKVLKGFHKALNRDGILWLGTAESLSEKTRSLFKPIYKNEKIFRKV